MVYGDYCSRQKKVQDVYLLNEDNICFTIDDDDNVCNDAFFFALASALGLAFDFFELLFGKLVVLRLFSKLV